MARSFDGGQKLNPTFWSDDCRTPSARYIVMGWLK